MTVGDEIPVPGDGFRAPGTGLMVAGSLISALAVYVFQVIGGRTLGAEGFAPVSVLWTLAFILATVVLVPVEQHTTREAASGRKVLSWHALVPSLVAIALASLAGLLFVWSTLDEAFLGDRSYLVVTGVLLLSYGLYEVGKGLLAGHRRFGLVGGAMMGESLGRLVLGVAFLAVTPEAISLGWAMALATLTVLGTRFWRFDHETSSGSIAGASKFLGIYVLASAASQMLLAGAPLAVLALGGGPELISIAFVTFTLYRAPLTLTYLLQGRLLPYLVANGRDWGASRDEPSHLPTPLGRRRVVFGGSSYRVPGRAGCGSALVRSRVSAVRRSGFSCRRWCRRGRDHSGGRAVPGGFGQDPGPDCCLVPRVGRGSDRPWGVLARAAHPGGTRVCVGGGGRLDCHLARGPCRPGSRGFTE